MVYSNGQTGPPSTVHSLQIVHCAMRGVGETVVEKNEHVTITVLSLFMPLKRTHDEARSDDINSLFDLIFNAASASPEHMKYLTALKSRVLSDLSSTKKEKTQAAKEFTLFEAVHMFGLKYERIPTEYSQKHLWNIDKEVEGKEFPTTACIGETHMPSC
jgi:hypothetical protein